MTRFAHSGLTIVSENALLLYPAFKSTIPARSAIHVGSYKSILLGNSSLVTYALRTDNQYDSRDCSREGSDKRHNGIEQKAMKQQLREFLSSQKVI